MSLDGQLTVLRLPSKQFGSRGKHSHGQDHRHRPGHHQLRGRDHGGQGAEGHRQRGRLAPDSVGGRLRREGRGPRRPDRPSSGHHEPREHRVLEQALHGSQVQRSDHAGGDRSASRSRSSPASNGDVVVRDPRQALLAAGDRCARADEAEARRRGVPRRAGDRSGHHRPRVLQRQPAPGDQGRRQDRRPRGQAHHQRADRGRARLRSRQDQGAADRRVRHGRRHLRHLGPRGR